MNIFADLTIHLFLHFHSTLGTAFIVPPRECLAFTVVASLVLRFLSRVLSFDITENQDILGSEDAEKGRGRPSAAG